MAGFRRTVVQSVFLLGGITISIAATKFLESWVAISWRTSLSNYLQERYLQRLMYYKLNVLDRTVDNPFVQFAICG